MNVVFNNNRARIIEPGRGSSAASKSSAEGALPVNDSVRSIMSLEYVVVDQQSFVSHPGFKVHRLAYFT